MSKEIKHKQLAVFDIDGTIFRSSLLIELNAKLVAEGIFPERAKDEVARVREAWLNRHGNYFDYALTIQKLYERDIQGVRVTDLKRISRELIAEQKHRVYVYTRDLIKKFRRNHTLIIISYLPTEVVQEFNRFYKFNVVTGIVYKHRQGKYTGEIIEKTRVDKELLLKRIVREHGFSLRKSIGVGDTQLDIGFLKLVEHPIAFNPNKKLYSAARKNKWQIVVERKDMVYKI